MSAGTSASLCCASSDRVCLHFLSSLVHTSWAVGSGNVCGLLGQGSVWRLSVGAGVYGEVQTTGDLEVRVMDILCIQ